MEKQSKLTVDELKSWIIKRIGELNTDVKNAEAEMLIAEDKNKALIKRVGKGGKLNALNEVLHFIKSHHNNER